MASNLLPNLGVPAFAYAAAEGDAAALWPCFLTVDHAAPSHEATIALRSRPADGSDHPPTFTLIYNADNLTPGANQLGHVTVRLPHASYEQLARGGAPQLQTLTVSLKAPCPVYCDVPASQASQLHTHPLFVEVATARRVMVIFDWSWVHKRNWLTFQSIVNTPEGLQGVRDSKRTAKLYLVPDVSALRSADAAVELPPAYTETLKRARRNTISSTSSSPTARPPEKRVHFEPPPHTSSDKANPATPRPPLTYADGAWLGKWLETAVEAHVNKIVPGIVESLLASPSSRTAMPAPPPTDQPRWRKVIEDAVEAHVHKVIPGMLQNLLAPTSPQSPIHAYLQTLLRDARDDVNTDIAALHSAAEDEVQELLSEQRLDVISAKDDSIVEINYLQLDKMDEIKQCAATVMQELDDFAKHDITDLQHQVQMHSTKIAHIEDWIQRVDHGKQRRASWPG